MINEKEYKKLSLNIHKKFRGKISLKSKIRIKTKKDLSLIYTPGVVFPCLEIIKKNKNIYKYTNKGNTVAIITNGTAVLGLGNIGPEASLPVMEGKALLFKHFANIDAQPVILNSSNIDEIIFIIKSISLNFGGINLEDIKAPDCFYIEKELKKQCDIPVFHDDQHGTAIVTLAGILNSLKLVNKKIENIKITINGAGAAGIAIANILIRIGAKNIFLCDRNGIIYSKRKKGMNIFKYKISKIINKQNHKGKLEEAIKNSDVFIGVSEGNIISQSMIKTMNKDAIVFALANPIPEIMPELAIKAGARIVATGRSDFPNQINNMLVFPGIFRGVLDAKAKFINMEMKIAAAKTIASMIKNNKLSYNYIIPNSLDKNVSIVLAKKIYKIAKSYKK